MPRFNPDKEDLTWAPVWIRLYSLPDEYSEEDCLKGIGNGVGEYIRAADETKTRKYISYARICVFIRLNEALPESVTLTQLPLPIATRSGSSLSIMSMCLSGAGDAMHWGICFGISLSMPKPTPLNRLNPHLRMVSPESPVGSARIKSLRMGPNPSLPNPSIPLPKIALTF